ncbi:hypothetical protein WKU33_05655 [Oceanobacillus sp. HCA-5259]|uniref:DUF6115 domain-containing protein n=1 Tax=Oceanobacillus sp. HCA-5259 TaxID=3134661 RepID=UPI0030C2267C
MVSFLLIISFLLHLITLVAIFQLLKKGQQLENTANSAELTAALERSLEEIKAENDRLQALMTNHKASSVEQKNQKEESQQPAEQVPAHQPESEEADADVDRLLGDAPGYELEASLESRVMQLHAKGLTIEEIAKALDCGKTEAELIIRLYDE